MVIPYCFLFLTYSTISFNILNIAILYSVSAHFITFEDLILLSVSVGSHSCRFFSLCNLWFYVFTLKYSFPSWELPPIRIDDILYRGSVFCCYQLPGGIIQPGPFYIKYSAWHFSNHPRMSVDQSLLEGLLLFKHNHSGRLR